MAEPSNQERPRRRLRGYHADFLARTGLVIITVALVIYFSLGPNGGVFSSGADIRDILAGQAVVAIIALAFVFPLGAGHFDLSVGAVAGLSSLGSAALMTKGAPVAVGIAFGIALGLFVGVINGFLVAKMKLNGFIITLGTSTLIGGLTAVYNGGAGVSAGIPESYLAWGAKNWIGMPRLFVVLLITAAVCWYVLENTPFGRYLDSIGSNETGAREVGIAVDRTIYCAYLVSGCLAALAGILLTIRVGSANPNTGQTYLFPALTAVFLGATVIRPGRYNVIGTLIGAYFVGIVVTGFTLRGTGPWVEPVFDGASLVVAVALSTLFFRRRHHG